MVVVDLVVAVVRCAVCGVRPDRPSEWAVHA
jgi:hypothetical protein